MEKRNRRENINKSAKVSGEKEIPVKAEDKRGSAQAKLGKVDNESEKIGKIRRRRKRERIGRGTEHQRDVGAVPGSESVSLDTTLASDAMGIQEFRHKKIGLNGANK